MSYHVNLKIAEMTFSVSFLHKATEEYVRKFITYEAGEHRIDITQADIEYERQICADENNDISDGMRSASDPMLETTAMLRKVSEYVVDHNRVLMHGSAIAVNGKGYIFTALSGTGKSTHTSLLRKLHGENAVMVNDDKPFLYLKNGKTYVCGTPWMGKHKLGNNMMVPLEGIFFLRRSEENEIKSMRPEEAVSLLLPQCHRPADPMKMMNTLDMVDTILRAVPLYDFGCNMDISAAETSSSVMK